METVSFRRMDESTAADWELLGRYEEEMLRALPDRMLEAVEALGSSFGGYKVTRKEHSLQSATRAFRDGRSEEYAVAALLHDVGDVLAPHTHGEMMDAVLKPFVAEEIRWVVAHHGVFQEHYYGHLTGGNRNARERYRGHPWFDAVPSSASSTTRIASTRRTSRCRSSSSSRWCAGCSRSRATSSAAPRKRLATP